MSVCELRELLYVDTPLGRGYAWLVDHGEHDNWYTVILDNGALVTFPQKRVRARHDYTHDRGIDDRQMRKIIGE